MKKITCLALMVLAIFFSAKAWVYTTVDYDDKNYVRYYSQEIKFKSDENKNLNIILCGARSLATGKRTYFMIFIDKAGNRSDNQLKKEGYDKGAVMKFRLGSGDVFDTETVYSYDFVIEHIKQKKDETLRGAPIFESTRDVADLKVWYPLATQQIEGICDFGIKKMRRERRGNNLDDFNFSDKEAKKMGKTIRKHLDNLNKKIDEFDALVRKKKAEKAKNPQNNSQTPKTNSIGEF